MPESSFDNGGYLGCSYTDTFDPYYDNLLLGLPMGGPGLSHGSTTFTDCSPNPKTVTVGGSIALSSAQSKFYGLSGSFPGATQLTLAGLLASTVAAAGADYTLEGWFRPSAAVEYGMIGTTGSYIWGININSSGYPRFSSYSGGDAITSTSIVVANQWMHVAGVKSGLDAFLFVNGVIAAAGAASSSVPPANGVLVGGYYQANSYGFTGYMQDVLITAAAKYTSNFTPPTRGYLNKARRYPSGIYMVS